MVDLSTLGLVGQRGAFGDQLVDSGLLYWTKFPPLPF